MPNGAREAIELLAEQNRQMINWSHLHDLVLQLQVRFKIFFLFIYSRHVVLFLFTTAITIGNSSIISVIADRGSTGRISTTSCCSCR